MHFAEPTYGLRKDIMTPAREDLPPNAETKLKMSPAELVSGGGEQMYLPEAWNRVQ